MRLCMLKHIARYMAHSKYSDGRVSEGKIGGAFRDNGGLDQLGLW